MNKPYLWWILGLLLLLPACSFGFALSRILPPIQPAGPPMQQVETASPSPSGTPSSGALGL